MTDKLEKSSDGVEEIVDASWESLSATSFRELMTPPEDDPLNNILDLSTALRNIIYNIMFSETIDPMNKKDIAMKAVQDFNSLCQAALSIEPDKPNNPLFDAIKSVFEKARKVGKKKPKKIMDEDSRDVSTSSKESSLMVFKDNSGKFRWIAAYSNAYRDNDFPPEIISGKSHERFVELVDSGQAPYPELWHWHVPGTRWGVADFVDYDKENGIALASGTVDEGHEKEAMLISQSDEPIILSHGMPVSSIVRDPDDNTVIVEHITREISDLPRLAAANKLTEFHVMTEEKEMGLSDKKKDYLLKYGVSEDMISAIESNLASTAKSATEAGIERKETSEEVTTTPVVETTPPVTETIPEPVAEIKENAKPEVIEEVPQYATKEEVAVVIAELLTTANKEVLSAIEALGKRLTAVEEKSADNANWTPMGSLAGLVARNMSVIGSDEANVRKDSKLVRGPEEVKSGNDGALVNTGFAPLNEVLSDIARRGGGK